MRNEKNPELQRVFEKPIKIFGKQLKIIRVMLIASVGVLYTGMLYNETLSYTPLVFGALLLAILLIAAILKLKKILYFGKYNLECSSAGDVYITQLQGICPKCKGSLKISKRNNKKVILCDQNSNHIWNLKE